MIKHLNADDVLGNRVPSERESAVKALRTLPEHCFASVSDLARRIGIDKLVLIRWSREDVAFARVVESKIVTAEGNVVTRTEYRQ
jgi:hypothetical protein